LDSISIVYRIVEKKEGRKGEKEEKKFSGRIRFG
jgi:hypothetical protein